MYDHRVTSSIILVFASKIDWGSLADCDRRSALWAATVYKKTSNIVKGWHLQRFLQILTVHVNNGSSTACIVKSSEISEWIKVSVRVNNVGNSLVILLNKSIESIGECGQVETEWRKFVELVSMLWKSNTRYYLLDIENILAFFQMEIECYNTG